MIRTVQRWLVLVTCVLPFGFSVAVAAETKGAGSSFRYPAGRHKAAKLEYLNGLPVLVVEGTPEEIGEQIGVLAVRPAETLTKFPKDVLKANGVEHLWPLLVQAGRAMLARFPDDHRRELRALADASGADYDTLVAVNTIDDLERIGGCSSLTLDAAHSTTDGALMGRNLDYPTLGYLHHYSLITVYRPKGKIAFSSVGFPGMLGVLSGMNEAGLTLVTHEVGQSADGSPPFSPEGAPMTLSFRRVMEECRTVGEAERLLRSVKRTTYLSVALCDQHEAAVFELTPRSLVVRRPEQGMLVCTNHFRSQELRKSVDCRRYDALAQKLQSPKCSHRDLWLRMHSASGSSTLQTMIFEPVPLTLHLSIGVVPATSRPPKTLELAELLRKCSQSPETRNQVEVTLPEKLFEGILGPPARPLGNDVFEVTFSYRPKQPVKSVHVAGTFNDWNMGSHKMDGRDQQGRFTTRLKLKKGKYEYKFVLDGQIWQADPDNVLQTGLYRNSVFYVGAEP